MNHQRLLRIFILTEVFSVVATVIAGIIFEGTLPEPLRTYAATQELPPFLLIVALILLVLMIVAWVGLWRSAPWAPAVYAVMWVSCVVIVPFGGPNVGTGIEEMFNLVGTAAGGGILALLLVAREERRSGRTALADASSGTLNDAGDPGRPGAVTQPNIKSSRVHQILSGLYGLIALMLLALPFVARTGEEGLRSSEMAIALAIPLFFFTLTAFHYVVSRGAKERKRWARIGSIVLACLLLPGVPVGTIIGVYLLRNSSWEPRSAVAPGG